MVVVVILFVRHDRDNVRAGTIVVKILRQCTSSRLVELMAEQQDSASAHADLEQTATTVCTHTTWYPIDVSARVRDCARAVSGETCRTVRARFGMRGVCHVDDCRIAAV
jgi:hypothetical protein